MANRIHLKGAFRHEEAVSGIAGIYPGMLVKLDSDGKVVLHTTSGGALGDEVLVAAEDALHGKTVSTVYTLGAIVSLIIPQRGCELNLLIAVDEEIAVADKIMSGGDGTFVKNSGGTVVIGVATEANDLSDSGDANTLSAVRIS